MAPKKKAPAKKKATAVKGGVAKKSAAKAEPEATAEIPKGGVLIEACKSWNAFKTRAAKIESAVKAKGKKVSINPVRPGKGNFVVKTEKKTVVSLIGLARPFPKLKALDMDKVCADVVAAL